MGYTKQANESVQELLEKNKAAAMPQIQSESRLNHEHIVT